MIYSVKNTGIGTSPRDLLHDGKISAQSLENEVVGIAGASEDCDLMWQIGVDFNRVNWRSVWGYWTAWIELYAR